MNHSFTAASRPKMLMDPVKRSSVAALISLRYLLLRFSTAGSALVAGLIQTFVFARVLSPERFSIFILVGTLGVSLWLFDLGFSKILFVKLRARHLAGDDTQGIARQASGIVLLYGVLAVVGAVACFTVMWGVISTPTWDAAEFSLFFLFCALNLAWFALRNLSVAVDEFIFFETLEAVRRAGHIAAMLLLLAGLSFPAFLIGVNILWGLLFTFAIARLARCRALPPNILSGANHLGVFFRENRAAALRTGAHAAGELYIHNMLYLVVPLVLGLGAPTIVLDTTLKIFYGVLVLYSAACDLLVPRQTRAFAERDASTLVRATLAAAALCAVPAAMLGGILWLDAGRLFALLLGPAATMPSAAAPILAILLVAGIVKTASNFLLQHTGFFKEIARLAIFTSGAMTIIVAIGIWESFDIVGFLRIFAAVYAGCAILYLFLALRGPIRTAHKTS